MVTTARLLSWILAALCVQVLVGVLIVLHRRRGRAQPATPPASPPAAVQAGAAWQGARAMRVRSRVFEDAACTQCSFELEPVDGQSLPAFKPGQFLTFALQPAAPAGSAARTLTRCYSLSDRPEPDHYRVTIKRVPAPEGRPDLPAGEVSNHFHDQVQVGDVLQVRAPAGHFYIDAEAALPAVLLAGGIGITPLMSMLRWCLAQQPQRRLHLYYGVRHGGEHAFKAQLQALAAAHPQLSLHVAYSRPGEADHQGLDYQHAGRVDLALLQRTLPHGRHAFYLCGPGAMMETLVPALQGWGVPDADIHFEAFGPASRRRPGASVLPPAAAQGVAIRFERAGRSLIWDGQDTSLLDFAERHGVAVDSGCRSGGCGSCQTRLLSGTVVYDQVPDHDVAAGHCLLCVGRPATALALEA
ncbi:MAG TPA: 2Fe-2S iron-sulfur cluster-binding protein [Rubrivivax sp.]|nr:2Fe-2S iron-sulfur cluster-binding protein [Rubrivivax sp.]